MKNTYKGIGMPGSVSDIETASVLELVSESDSYNTINTMAERLSSLRKSGALIDIQALSRFILMTASKELDRDKVSVKMYCYPQNETADLRDIDDMFDQVIDSLDKEGLQVLSITAFSQSLGQAILEDDKTEA